MPSSHWGRKTRSVVAPEAAVLWSELTEENPGCSSGIAHQPKVDRKTQIKNTHTYSSISSGLRVQVNVCEDVKESKWTEAIRRYGLLVSPCRVETFCAGSGTSTSESHLLIQAHQQERQSTSSRAAVLLLPQYSHIPASRTTTMTSEECHAFFMWSEKHSRGKQKG